MFLTENVKRFVTHDKGKTLKTMLKVFEEVEYIVTYKVLNVLDYGVAQNRQRVAIVGIKKNIKNIVKENFEFPEPLKKTYTNLLKI